MTIEEFKSVDVRTVDRESLVDINEIVIDESLPPKERAEEFLRQIKNPYCFRVRGFHWWRMRLIWDCQCLRS